MKYLLLSLVVFAFTANAEVTRKAPTKEMVKKMVEMNAFYAKTLANTKSSNFAQITPYAEFSHAKYLIFSDGYNFDSKFAKLEMARNLPLDMTLVIYTQSSSKSQHKRILKDFGEVIDLNRVKLIHTPSRGNGFWARDGIPLPAWGFDGSFYLTDAKYYHNFEPDELFSKYFNAGLISHPFAFEGGNFMANSLGDCVVVNKLPTQQIPDAVFSKAYGCLNIVRLPYVKGIGHVDESFKFMDDVNVITDEPSYKPILESHGFNVTMVPRPKNGYETYVNALLVNGTAFVPIFNQDKDKEALDVYRSFGLNTIGINTSVLSNQGLGSLHCITMTYPDVKFNELLGILNGQSVNPKPNH